MTKYEWERQLKKGISGLPKKEQQRVLDYYNELFADKIDAGMREQYIIAEFGNPYDVANKILTDFYTEGKETEETDAYVYSPVDEIDCDFEETRAATHKKVEKEPVLVEVSEKTEKESTSKTTSEKFHRKFVAVEPEKDTSQNKRRSKSAFGLSALLCVMLFFVLGACFNAWHPAWLVFLLIPVIESLIQAIEKRNFRIFAYPVFITFVYLLLGIFAHMWHPMWILFITIPIYYVLGNYIVNTIKDKTENKRDDKSDKDDDDKCGSDEKVKPTDKKEDEPKPIKDANVSKKKSSSSIFAGVVTTIVMVFLIVSIWSLVVSMFVSGIGMMVGGVAAVVWAAINMSATFNVAMVALGGGIAVFGLGLIFTIGMSYLFKACARVSKELCNVMNKCFDKKEKA